MRDHQFLDVLAIKIDFRRSTVKVKTKNYVNSATMLRNVKLNFMFKATF